MRIWDRDTAAELACSIFIPPSIEIDASFSFVYSHTGLCQACEGMPRVSTAACIRAMATTSCPPPTTVRFCSWRLSSVCGFSPLHAGQILLWDIFSATEVASLSGHTDSVPCLAIRSDNTVVSVGGDEVKLWGTSANTDAAAVAGGGVEAGFRVAMQHSCGVCAVLLLRGSDSVVSAADSGEVAFFSVLYPAISLYLSTFSCC